MISIKIVEDKESLATAFQWSNDAPRWFRESQEEESLESFLLTAKDNMFIGVFADDRLTALLRFIETMPNVVSVDLFARRDTDKEILKNACIDIKDYLFANGVRGIYGWIVRQNRFVVRLYEYLGFQYRGVKCFRGSIGNRPAEWRLFEIS